MFNLTGMDIYQSLRPSLQEIRLLTVLRGKFEEPINCLLRRSTCDLEICPNYETVSYCWGDPRKRDRLVVNGIAILAPASSIAAIRRMRLLDQERILWIDAICINQADLAERSVQVALMGRIYQRARRNLIYLGEDEGSDPEHINRCLANIEQKLKIKDRWLQNTAGRGSYSEDEFRLVVKTFSAVSPLYKLPWFSRVWVVQEAAMAFENICFWGSSTFSLDDALRFGSTAFVILSGGQYDPPLGEDFPTLFAAMILFYQVAPESRRSTRRGQIERQGTSMYDLVQIGAPRSATDPRDFIFSLLELYRRANSPSIPDLLVPNYEKSVDDVFRDATRFMIMEENGANVLLEGYHRSEDDITGFKCSWTRTFDRDWDIYKDARFLDPSTAGLRPNDVNGAYNFTIENCCDINVLALSGFIVGRVSWTAEPLTLQELWTFNTVNLVVEDVLAWSREKYVQKACKIEDSQLQAAEILTAGSGLALHEDVFESPWEKSTCFDAFINFIRNKKCLPSYLGKLSVDADASTVASTRFYHAHWTLMAHRCYFGMHTGRMGCGPKWMQSGDIVAVLKGAKYPVILRPMKGHYRYVGEAYVAGLMSGEVFDMDLKQEFINLR